MLSHNVVTKCNNTMATATLWQHDLLQRIKVQKCFCFCYDSSINQSINFYSANIPGEARLSCYFLVASSQYFAFKNILLVSSNPLHGPVQKAISTNLMENCLPILVCAVYSCSLVQKGLHYLQLDYLLGILGLAKTCKVLNEVPVDSYHHGPFSITHDCTIRTILRQISYFICQPDASCLTSVNSTRICSSIFIFRILLTWLLYLVPFSKQIMQN